MRYDDWDRDVEPGVQPHGLGDAGPSDEEFVAGPAASLSAHHEGGNLACPACAAEYELTPKAEARATEAPAGSFACPACAAKYDVTTSAPVAPIKFLDAPADSFACPSCAAEIEAFVT